MRASYSDVRLLPEMSEAEIAALDFTPWDKNGPCPVPSSAQYEEMKRVAPWLRIAFLHLCLNKQELADALDEMPQEDLDSLEDVVRTTGDNCRAMAAMCDAIQARSMVAYAVLVEREARSGGSPQ